MKKYYLVTVFHYKIIGPFITNLPFTISTVINRSGGVYIIFLCLRGTTGVKKTVQGLSEFFNEWKRI